MNKKLHIRLAAIIIGIATVIILISTVSVILSTHYHFVMYQNQLGEMLHSYPSLSRHFEMALVQSVLWSALGSIVLAMIMGYYAARRISSPLVEMKKVAEQMAAGRLNVTVNVSGNDELAMLGQSLNELAKQLDRQEKLRVTMTEDIAHELRTPLTTLKSHMRAFEDGIWEPTPERIHSCYEEIERLTLLVGELEELNAMESPGFRLVKQEVRLGAIAAKGVELVAASFMEKKITLHNHIPQGISLQADPDRLIQVLVNLLTNALKYTPEQGEVHIEARNEEDTVLLTIKDTGVGIAPEDLPHIFNRFYRGEKSRNRKTGGSGLGLAIVDKLVKAHGGKIWAESGQGAIFCVELPK
ncbi:sensor histidine kinase [Paenibacillus abyssi]|uniref:histidine kinase n=1 Tax=Paenibacillus abyssi TaxID=1340531 RepID=A0A917G5W7_9BACL|nr:ATP-binding protein [Paenibacillus abyssi]GGG24369.1 hypothetical protein GCM10010916_46110 [Paenibacillus abyssi]